MKRSMVFKSLLAAFCVVLATFFFAGLIWRNNSIDAQRAQMKDIIAAASNTSSVLDYLTIGDNFPASGEGTGIDVITPDGEIASGYAQAAEEPAALSALHTGYGEFIGRRNEGDLKLFVALKIKGMYIIQVSQNILTWGQMLWAMLPALIVGFLISLAAALLLASYFMRKIRGPFSQVVGLFREMSAGRYNSSLGIQRYPEFDELAVQINSEMQKITRNFRHYEDEIRRTSSLLDNMSEGLIVLDRGLNIRAVNRSALNDFGVSEEIRGKNLLNLTYSAKVADAAATAIESAKASAVELSGRSDGRILRLNVSPVTGDGQTIGGAVILVTDITAERKAEQIRSDFVANVSHELKTPLTSIKGFAELIGSGIIEEREKIEKYMGLIQDETARMIALIDDILKLSELESLKADSGESWISLKSVAERAAESLSLQAADKDVTISVEGSTGKIRANPDKMLQLLLNLIDNAVKYNRPGGKVNVLLSEDETSVTARVEDTGIGIPPDAADRVFERFYRVDKSRSRKLGGTGLGLAIVKHIIELYRGHVSLQSTLGKGTVIEVTLPVQRF